jgi:hypothetical protein
LIGSILRRRERKCLLKVFFLKVRVVLESLQAIWIHGENFQHTPVEWGLEVHTTITLRAV